LNNIPLKTVTVDDMASQVEELATEADNHDTHTRANKPYLATAKSIEKEVQELLPMVDGEEIKDTMIACCGYYLGKAGELRVQPQTILDGLKKWSVDALGLPTPPYISDHLLAKLGLRTGRAEKSYGFGSRRAPYPGSTQKTTMPSWAGRGNQRRRDDRSGQPGGRRFSRDSDEVGYRDRDNYRQRERHFANRTA